MSACPDTIEEIAVALKQARETDFHFQCLYERYFPRLRFFFLRKKISPEETTELIQEVFFSVYQHLGSLRATADFEGWLFSIALNAFRNHLEKSRAQKRTARLVELDGEEGEITLKTLAADILTPLENVLESEREQIFFRAINELPEQMQRVFYLKVIGEMRNEQISALLGISVHTVKAHVFQARQKLQQSLAKDFKQ